MLKIKELEPEIQILLKNGCAKDDLANFIREKTGLKETQVRAYTKKFFGPIPSKENVKVEKSATEQTLQYAGDDLINVENLLKKCNVNSKSWEVTKFTLEEKHIVKKVGNVTEFCPKYDVKAWLQKREVDQEDLLKNFIESASKYSPAFSYQKISQNKDRKYLLELTLFDLHASRLVWGREISGEDYDIKIAVNLYRKAVDDLLNKTPLDEVKEILFPIGNDFFNSDNEVYTTTAGTPMHDDSRWQKSFSVGCDLMVETIEKLTTVCDKVTALIVPGNHDRQKVFYLGEYLNAWFKNNDRVVIENSPCKRKYFTFGRSLIGLTHGCDEKHADLPLIMAREQKVAWGNSLWYYFHLGHLHHQITKDYKGVVVDVLPSLSANDDYHHKRGFIGSVRSAQAFLYDPEDGLISIFYHKVHSIKEE